MCGLIGAFRANGAHLQKLDHFMWQGLYLSALRGMGGTGVGVVHGSFEMDFAKSHVSSPNFLCSEEWDWIDKNLTGCRAVLGHTRSATQGTVKTKNSHPFMHDEDIKGTLMIHNGHIKNWAMLTPTTFNAEVDSAHVAHALHHKGAMETLKELEGAYTLVWYDKATKSMNLARNEERELFCTYNKEHTCLWFASELDMLSCVLKRNGIPHEREFFELPKFTHCTFDLTKNTLEMKKTVYEEKKYLPAVYPNYGGRNGSGTSGNEDYRSFTKTVVEIGDCIWTNVRDPDDVAFRFYKEIGDGENQVPQEQAYGFVYGTRSMDFGSVVRVVGLNYNDWEKRVKYIKTCIPTKIVRMEKGLKNEQTGQPYNLFEVTIVNEKVDEELLRIDSSIKARKAREAAEAKAALIAAGRDLPVPQTNESGEGLVVESPGDDICKSDPVGPHDGGSSGRQQQPGVGLTKPSYISYPEKVPGPKGAKIAFADWERTALEGCYICDGVILHMDIGKVEWWEHPRNCEDRDAKDSEYQMICPICKENPKKVMELVG